MANLQLLGPDMAICGSFSPEQEFATVGSSFSSFVAVSAPEENCLPGFMDSFTDRPKRFLALGEGLFSAGAGMAMAAEMAALPKPTLIVCKSGRRAGAMATVYQALLNGWSGAQAVAYGQEKKMTWVAAPGMIDWVTACAEQLKNAADGVVAAAAEGSAVAAGGTAAAIPRRGAPRALVFRQLFDPESSTYTYILADPTAGNEGVIIDPVDTQAERDALIMSEMGVNLRYALNTHVHADHITGTGKLKALLPGCKSVISEASSAVADVKLAPRDKVHFGGRWLEARATPGHTAGCMTFVTDDRSMAFTGDALLIRGCGRTDFQGGSSELLYQSVHSQIFTLPNDTTVYPAHDYKGRMSSSVGEERKFNSRLTKPLAEFAAIMAGLGLPKPKKIDVAVPANLACGVYEL